MTNLLQQPPAQPQGPEHYYLGFNLVVERLAIMRLMGTVGAAVNSGAKSISICMSSPGGSPEQAFYAYEILKACSVPIVTVNVGSIQSAAVPIFMAGKERFAVPHANFLMHQTLHHPAPGGVTQDLLANGLESIQADDKRAMEIVAEESGNDIKTVKKWFSGQTLRTAKFAKDHKIIDAIKPLSYQPNSTFVQIQV